MSEPLSRTSLTKFAHLFRDPDPAGARRFAQDVYDEHKILIVLPSDVQRGFVEEMFIDALARKLYPNGKRR